MFSSIQGFCSQNIFLKVLFCAANKCYKSNNTYICLPWLGASVSPCPCPLAIARKSIMSNWCVTCGCSAGIRVFALLDPCLWWDLDLPVPEGIAQLASLHQQAHITAPCATVPSRCHAHNSGSRCVTAREF